ncbi:hypothetical protein BJX70DRAFT_398954 [Aspergillus crustosus]
MLYSCKVQGNTSASANSAGGNALLAISAAQILISLAAGAIMVADEVAILATVATTAPPESTSSDKTGVGTSLAVLGIFGNIGAAVGLTIASALWQHIFPSRLERYLQDSSSSVSKGELDAIYSSISTQLSFPVGSPTRAAISKAYGDALVWMVGVGMGIWVLGFLAVLCCEDIDVASTSGEAEEEDSQ